MFAFASMLEVGAHTDSIVGSATGMQLFWLSFRVGSGPYLALKKNIVDLGRLFQNPGI